MDAHNLPPEYIVPFKFYMSLLNLVGLDLFSSKPLRKHYIYICLLIGINVVVFLQISFLVKRTSTPETFCDHIFVFFTVVLFVQCYVSMVVWILKRKQIRSLIIEIAELWPIDLQNEEKLKTKVVWLARLNMFGRGYTIILGFGLVLSEFLPLVSTGVNYLTNSSMPFDLYRPPLVETDSKHKEFFWLLLQETVGLSTRTCVHTCGMMMLNIFTCHISLLLRLLQIDLKNVVKFKYHVNSSALAIDHDATYEAVITAVKRHQKLLRLCHKLNDIFGIVIFITLYTSYFFICCLLFLSVVSAVAPLNLFASIAAVADLFNLCWPGQILLDESLNVAHSAFRSLWYKSDSMQLRKNLLLIITRSQKPAKLSAMGISDLSLATYMSALASVWSYLSILRTMYQDI